MFQTFINRGTRRHIKICKTDGIDFANQASINTASLKWLVTTLM